MKKNENKLARNAENEKNSMIGNFKDSNTMDSKMLDFKYELLLNMQNSADRMWSTMNTIKSRIAEVENRMVLGDSNFNTCGIFQGLEAKLDRAMIEYKTAEKSFNRLKNILKIKHGTTEHISGMACH